MNIVFSSPLQFHSSVLPLPLPLSLPFLFFPFLSENPVNVLSHIVVFKIQQIKIKKGVKKTSSAVVVSHLMHPSFQGDLFQPYLGRWDDRSLCIC